MRMWVRTYVWGLFFEMLAVVLSVLAGIGAIISAQAIMEGQPSIVLLLGVLACLIALTLWWRYAKQYVAEPDPVLDDPRPYSARFAADLTTALLGIGIVTICVVQIVALDESQTRWGLLATILGGPFVALGLGVAWERWNTRMFG
jgi:hypothetical protein